MEQIRAIITRRGFRMAENNRKQAFIPQGAIPIENPKGTAPGFIVEGPDWVTITLPGVPSEMEFLLRTAVIPYLRKRFNLDRQIIQYRVLRACGLGESAIGLQIQDLMRESKNPTVGTLASVGDIKIRITAKAYAPEEADQLLERMEEEIRRRLGILIYGVDDETLQENTMRYLENRNLTLSVAEVFTNGLISQKLGGTGSPAFVQGIVLPSEISQRRFLNIPGAEFDPYRKDLQKLTDSLAQRVKQDTGTDLGLSSCGRISEEQIRGEFRIKVCHSLATDVGIEYQEQDLGGEPQNVRERSSIIAIDSLRKYLLKVISSK